MIEKFVEISLLYDFYGKTLTEKQKDIVDLYYMKDLSLGEISEIQGISRQGVYDNLRRAEKHLRTMEGNFGLVKRFLMEKEKWNTVLQRIENIIAAMKDDNRKMEDIKVVEELRWIRDYICQILGG